MKFEKSSPELIARFSAALPENPAVEPRKMFGYPCSFVNGNFFTGLFQQDVVIRLPGAKERLPELAKAEGFNPMGKGNGMKDWWVIPSAISRDPGRLASLLDAAFAEVVKLPPKEGKKAAKKSAPAANRARKRG